MTVSTRYVPLEAFAIFCCGLILFTMGLGQQEIIGFESRFYLFALEMWRHGLSGFPTTYGSPYPDYPVTPTLMIYGIAKAMGQFNKLIAVFPSAMAAAVTLAVTYMIGALHNRRWGVYAVCFMLLTNTFLMEARTISPDQYIAMVTTVCFYLAYSAVLSQKKKRLWFIPLLFAIGFACRGPIGLVVPAGVLCVFYGLEKDIKQFFMMGFAAIIVLMIGSTALFGMAYLVGGMSFVQDVLHMEVSGRLQDAVLPWYFYFVESIGAYAVTYPLAILLVIGLGRGLLKSHVSADMKFIQKLAGWALIILVGLTIPAGKKIRYVLAFVPALALMSAYLFALPQRQKQLLSLQQIVYWFCYFLPLLCLAITLMIEFFAPQKHLLAGIPYSLLAILFLTLQWVCFIGRWRFSEADGLVVLVVAALTFVISYIWIVEPINLALNRTRDFVATTEILRHHNRAKLVFYQENPDAMPIKYVANMPQEDMPIFMNTPNEIEQLKTQAFFVVSEEHVATMPKNILESLRVVYSGSIGHAPVVIFAKKG